MSDTGDSDDLEYAEETSVQVSGDWDGNDPNSQTYQDFTGWVYTLDYTSEEESTDPIDDTDEDEVIDDETNEEMEEGS